jgi:hypothetical protein
LRQTSTIQTRDFLPLPLLPYGDFERVTETREAAGADDDLRECFDDLDQLVTSVALLPRESNKFPRL